LNRSGLVLIEEQNIGSDWLRRGLYFRQAAWRQKGWMILDWGVAQQASDGSFQTRDRFHSTMRYAQALALACLIDPDEATSHRKAALAKTLSWMASPKVLKKGLRGDAPFTHRSWMYGALLQRAFFVLGDRAYKTQAAERIEQAMRQQESDGAFPERGGFDVGYQMYSSSFCQRFLILCRDGSLYRRVVSAHASALRWYIDRMDETTGEVDIAGSSRVGSEVGHGGKGKTISYRRAVEVFMIASLMSNRPDYETAARLSLRADRLSRERAAMVKRTPASTTAAALTRHS
jgi:hypothetical protein